MNEQILRRNVLVIAYYFPPLGLSGVQRTLKFVKYLPQFGWQPTVLTVTPTGYFAHDPSLLNELDGLGIDIIRAGSLDPNRLFRNKGAVPMPSEKWRKVLTYLSDTFFIPDNKIGWKRKALQAASKILKEKKFEIIFATAPPFTDFLIGAELRYAFEIPLVLDYRDSWLNYPLKYYPTPFHRIRHIALERRALVASSRIITTNRRVKELILQQHNFLGYDDIVILPQGFDPEDFRDPAQRERNDNGAIFRITHAGVFYGDRTPKYFLQALRKIFVENPGMRGKIAAQFVGTFHENHQKIITALSLEESVTVTGYVEHAECIKYLQASDALWFMLNNDTQSPGKLYEYLGARKPILACVPDGFIRQTLHEAGACFITQPDDVDHIAKVLLDLYRFFEKRQLPRPKEEIVEKYDRSVLTKELSRVFGFLAE